MWTRCSAVLVSCGCGLKCRGALPHAALPSYNADLPLTHPLPLALQDAWNGTDRHHIDAYVPQQDLADSYLPPFQTGVEEGKVRVRGCAGADAGSDRPAKCAQ
jgi:hypothetical protein